ncbi:MAG: CPBP family intramembrane metalloprotease [Clostridia bacterium]|nr:CPBP family intramembrane metalloprotease [Clostridia bacterium]
MSRRNGYLLTYLLVMIGLTTTRIGFREGWFGVLSNHDSDLLFSFIAQVFCMGIIPLLGIGILADKGEGFRPLQERLYIKPVKDKRVIIISVLIALIHVVINGGVSTVWGMIVKSTGYSSVVADGEIINTFGGLILALFTSAVLPAFFEEITHRGLATSMTGGNVHKRVILSALLFALMHQNIMQTGYTFISGIVMGYLTVYTGSIFPAMLTHFVNNALVQIRIYSHYTKGLVATIYSGIYALMNTWWGMAILFILWALSVFVVVLLFLSLKKKGEREDIRLSTVVVEEGKREKVLSRFLWTAILTLSSLTTVYSYVVGLIR